MIETPRLILRPFEETDIEEAFGWFGYSTVMQFTPAGPDKSLEQTKLRIRDYQAHQAAHGFSKWVMVERSSSRLIGDSGLFVLEEYGWVDLGFRLARMFWGKGLATEAASAWTHAAFEDYQLSELGAFSHPDNVASMRVLEKLGFRPIRQAAVMGMEAVMFTLKSANLTP